MTVVILALTVLCALAGIAFILDFWSWFLKGSLVPGTIETFENHKPVFSFETEDGKILKRKAERITHMGYLLGRPKEGDVFNVVYLIEDPTRMRVSGYLYVTTGAFLFIPATMSLAVEFGRSWMFTQASFVLAFVAVMGLGWAALKWIRGNY